MDFFKSVFADEPDPQRSESDSQSPLSKEHSDPDPSSSSPPKPQNPNREASPSFVGGGDGWSFGGLIKTITIKSESVIETYRRDLKEFGSGLRKEIEVAQGSLENVGHAIDEIGSSVLKGTAQIISHGKDAILSLDHESDSSDNNNNDEKNITSRNSFNSKRYSRFDAQVRAIQGDASTYCEEPEDLDDYGKWKLGFVPKEKGEEIESLLEENGALGKMYKRVVPDSVDEETFWCRYYYKVYKLKQAEELRAKLVKRAISREEEEEELSWDVEDDDEEDEGEEEEDEVNNEIENKGNEKSGSQEDSTGNGKDGVEETGEVQKMDNEGFERNGKSFDDKMTIEESERTVRMKEEEEKGEDKSLKKMRSKEEKTTNEGCNVATEKVDLEKSTGDSVLTCDEKAGSEGKGDSGESCKDSEFSVVSSHPSMPEEEDLGWDEIEDLSSIDDKKMDHGGSANKADLRKRLSAAEEEEDLSWDIEDDDEPTKA